MADNKRILTVMNNPHEALDVEIPFLLSCGSDGFELTLEKTKSWIEDVDTHFDLVKKHCVIGHSRDDLALASADESTRAAALDLFRASIDVFKRLGIKKVNIHPHRGTPGLSFDEILRLNIESLKEASAYAKTMGITVMLENQPPFPKVKEMVKVFEVVGSEIHLLLDIAHAVCYSGPDEVLSFLDTFGPIISHIHITDNNGFSDDHLFPGYGVIDFPEMLGAACERVPSTTSFSLESFRVMDNGALRKNTPEERRRYTTEALTYLRGFLT